MVNDEERKWHLIEIISKASNDYGDKLIEAMQEACVSNTQQLTAEQAARYCERHGIKLEAIT